TLSSQHVSTDKRPEHLLNDNVLLCLRTPEFVLYTDSNMKSWKNAQAFCRKQHTDLVTITSKRHNFKFLNTKGWIGLHREDNLSGWKWSRSDKITNFTIWESNSKHARTRKHTPVQISRLSRSQLHVKAALKAAVCVPAREVHAHFEGPGLKF
uniref:C-type lectin domain-containing protein n=1 Tax=Mastacembelus armatus TaxID=205130 RepID=A0A3Q3N1L5_9TELE